MANNSVPISWTSYSLGCQVASTHIFLDDMANMTYGAHEGWGRVSEAGLNTSGKTRPDQSVMIAQTQAVLRAHSNQHTCTAWGGVHTQQTGKTWECTLVKAHSRRHPAGTQLRLLGRPNRRSKVRNSPYYHVD